MLARRLCNICTQYYLYSRIDKDGSVITNKCPAFPDGMPDNILSSEFLHFEKHPDQKNDIVFEFDNSGSPDVLERSKNLLENFKKKYELQKNETI